MPLFGKKKESVRQQDGKSKNNGLDYQNHENGVGKSKRPSAYPSSSHASRTPAASNSSSSSSSGETTDPYGQPSNSDELAQTRPKLIFHCQQAHGSPTACISGFSNVKELYLAIADAFDMDPSDVLFCTLNTHKIDMSRLLGGQIGLDDFIFVHTKGRPKEVEIMKDEDALGLTITDNGAGYSFIKRIKEGSIVSKIDGIYVGDHIEKINGATTVGLRHYEVAKMLKDLPTGSPFLLRVVEPMKSGFSNIGGVNRSNGKKSSNVGTGKETLRLRSKGPASIELPSDVITVAVDKINTRLESYLGINDNELAQTIWEVGCRMKNSVDFAEELQRTELAAFGFSEEFIFEIWGDIGDAKNGRIVKVAQFEERF